MAASDLLVLQCQALGLPEPICELRFHPPRRWRVDYAFPAHWLAVECEGMVWHHGRHTRGSGFVKDIEKYNQLALDGWFLLRFTPAMIEDGIAVQAIQTFLHTRCKLSDN